MDTSLESRIKTALGCLSAFAMLGFAFAILYPVFASARAAAKATRQRQAVRRLANALAVYVDGHGGKLPGEDWRARLERIDPGLRTILRGERDGYDVGYAAVPGTLGRKLDDLPDETILFVEYRAAEPTDLLHDVSDIGDLDRPGIAFAVAAGRVRGVGLEWSLPVAQIGLRLGRQGATELK